jgi:hypothetical protein
MPAPFPTSAITVLQGEWRMKVGRGGMTVSKLSAGSRPSAVPIDASVAVGDNEMILVDFVTGIVYKWRTFQKCAWLPFHHQPCGPAAGAGAWVSALPFRGRSLDGIDSDMKPHT